MGVSITPEEILPICKTLTTPLPAILSPSDPPSASDLLKFDKLIGPRTLVDDFLTSWSTHVSSLNIPNPNHPDLLLKLELLDPPYFRSEVSYATLDSIPPPSPQFFSNEKYHIVRAQGDDEALELAPLFVEFHAVGPDTATLEEGVSVLRDAIKSGRLWYCRYHDPAGMAGYIMLGRETPRTVAIKNVFVSANYRRKGIAEALVRAVTRYYLGTEPLGFELQRSEEGRKVKREVCLNVADAGAKRLYIRCGFLLADDARDPRTGRDGSYASIWRGLKVVEPEASKQIG